MPFKDTVHIGIAGAGISGLVAGTELQRAGYRVSIFESDERAGGRIRTVEMAGILVETGPEFIHGKLKETIALLKKYRIMYEPIGGKMFRKQNGHFIETFELAKDWDLLLNKMKSLDDDEPLQEFLEKNFRENHFKELKKMAIRFAEGYDLADIKTVSTKALLEEWDLGESEQYRIPAGYGTLIDSMVDEFKNLGGKLFLNHAVKKVDWSSDKIQIVIRNHKKFDLDKLIVSLPLSLLNKQAPSTETVVFYPSIAEKQKAFSEIGFGTVIKIVTIWDTPFWKKQIPNGRLIFSDDFIPTWWTQDPLNLPLLTGWLGGTKAIQFADEPDSFFLEKALETLSSLFSISIEETRSKLKDFRIFNWKNIPWIRGAYSYSMIGSGKAKAVCSESLQKRIYFTGEAFYDGPMQGTVEAAVVSGLKTVKLLLKEIKAH
jgi:monoamine oxidase